MTKILTSVIDLQLVVSCGEHLDGSICCWIA